MLGYKQNFDSFVSIDVLIVTKYIRLETLKALESVSRQTHPVSEVIIVINGDGSKSDINLDKYCHNLKIRVINKINLNSAVLARNVALKSSLSSYCAILDDDDEWEPNHIEVSLKVLNKTGAEVCFSGWIDRNGTKSRMFYPQIINIQQDIIKCPLALCHSSMVFKKSNKIKYPIYEVRHDFALWIKLFYVENTSCCKTDISTVIRNRHSGSLSSNLLKKIYFHFIVVKQEAGINNFKALILLVGYFIRARFRR